MDFSNVNRSVEVQAHCIEVSVKSTDYCCHFEKHPDTLLCKKECWTCRYSDFGIDTGMITEKGICKYLVKLNG